MNNFNVLYKGVDSGGGIVERFGPGGLGGSSYRSDRRTFKNRPSPTQGGGGIFENTGVGGGHICKNGGQESGGGMYQDISLGLYNRGEGSQGGVGFFCGGDGTVSGGGISIGGDGGVGGGSFNGRL